MRIEMHSFYVSKTLTCIQILKIDIDDGIIKNSDLIRSNHQFKITVQIITYL